MNRLYQPLKLIIIFHLFALLVFSPCFSQKVRIEKKDDITIVHNPKKPGEVPGAPKVLILEEDLCIGEESGDEEYMFAALRSVQVDEDEDIIVLDWKFNVIKVFDKKGMHIRTFGKHGQGPSEIQSPIRMYLKGGRDIGILDNANNRLSYFSKEGECLKETDLGKYTMLFRTIPDSRGFLYGDTFNIEKRMKMELIKFDSEFNPVMIVADFERVLRPREITPIMGRFVYQVMTDDRFVWAYNQEYVLHVLDPSGKLIKKIIKDYESGKVSEKDKEKMISERWGDNPPPSGFKLVFPKHFPPIYYFICDEKGRIYVRTYVRNAQGLIKWDVFDEGGRYILSFFHPEEDIVFVIKNDKAYSMILESEEGIPLVKRYRMIWSDQ